MVLINCLQFIFGLVDWGELELKKEWGVVFLLLELGDWMGLGLVLGWVFFFFFGLGQILVGLGCQLLVNLFLNGVKSGQGWRNYGDWNGDDDLWMF